MTTSKVCLLDTNVLVYAADRNSPFFESSRKLIESGFAGEIDLCISPQTISEFFAVITDSKRVQFRGGVMGPIVPDGRLSNRLVASLVKDGEPHP